MKANGTYDDTLIIFCSDHGEQLGENGFWGRHGPYDGNFHVPMIIRDPRETADPARGSRVTAFTEHVDLMPTILSALGLTVPTPCDGRSLTPFLRGETPTDWREETHFAYDFRDLPGRTAETALGLPSDACHFRAIRGERWKYVAFPSLPPLLYDLSNDPSESTNLAEDPQYADVLKACAERLGAFEPDPPSVDLSDWFQPYGGEMRQFSLDTPEPAGDAP